jgi:glycosyltransferase 2 family protein
VLALYLLLPKVVDTEQTLKYVSHASYWLLLAACGLEVLALAGYANLFRYILRVLDVRLHLHEAWAITISGLAVSHILSAGGVGGWVITYNALMKFKVPHGIIFVAIAAQQFFNYIVLWLFFAMSMVYLIVTRGGGSILGYLLGISLILAILAITSYGAYLYKHPDQLHRRAHGAARLANRTLRREVFHEHHIDGWIENLLIGMHRMTRHRGEVTTTLLLACVFWLFDMSCLWCTFEAFGVDLNIGYLLVGYVVAYSVGTLAPTPGGLGAIEGIMIALYVSFGVPSAVAVAVVLVYRIINFWLPIAPGFVAYAIVRPGRRPIAEGEIEEAAEEAPEELEELDARL